MARPGARSPPPAWRRARAGPVRVLDVRYPPDLGLPLHDHEHAYVCLVAAGGFTESWGGRERRSGPGTLFYYPEQVLHRGRYGRVGARVLHVEIPEGDLASVCPGGTDAGLRRDDLRDRPAAGLAWQLLVELETNRGPVDLAGESLVADMLAGLFGRPPRRERGRPAWVDTVEDILRGHRGTPPGLSAIATEVGRHPSHLARAYRRHTGSTLGQRARRLQVARAAARIAGSDTPLAQVAVESGFADQSHMGRVFKSLMRTTPAAYRRRTRPESTERPRCNEPGWITAC